MHQAQQQVQLGYSCPNKSHHLHVSMVGAHPTIVLVPFPWAIGAFHPLGRLGLGAGGRGGRLILFGI